MANKKVLIITYYWPPSGGGGVQRWVKFVKYLREFGWEPIVYIPEGADYPIEDRSLEKDVPKDITIIKRKIWEPYSYYSLLLGKKKGSEASVGLMSSKKEKDSFIKKFLIWIRGNLFIPDARKFWVKPSVRYLTNYLRKNKVDAIVTTGPPHSMHLIGMKLKLKLGVRWLADFRDPWVHMDNNIEDFKYSKSTLNKHLKLERDVLTLADKVVTVTPQIVEDYKDIRKEIDIITNGFDTDDFNVKKKPTEKFVVGHYGTLGKYRNPITLLKVLKDLCDENDQFNDKFTLELIGPVDNAIYQEVEKKGLTDYLKKEDYLPHKESIEKMINASILLLLLDKNLTMKGRMTGKIFEYLASKRPILGQGELDSDPVKLLNETGTGKMIEYDDYGGIRKFIEEQFELFLKNEDYILDTSKIDRYSRRELTKKLVTLLNEMIG